MVTSTVYYEDGTGETRRLPGTGIVLDSEGSFSYTGYTILMNSEVVEVLDNHLDAIRSLEAWEEMYPDSVFELLGEGY